MHVLFVHQNFPAQFGHIAAPPGAATRLRLHASSNERRPATSAASSASSTSPTAGPPSTTTTAPAPSRTRRRHAHAVYDALQGPARPRARPDRRPLAASAPRFSFASCTPTRRSSTTSSISTARRHSDMDFRPDFPPRPIDCLVPAPATRPSCSTWRTATLATARPHGSATCSPPRTSRKFADDLRRRRHRRSGSRCRTARAGRRPSMPDGIKVVTYVAAAWSAMRGFDIFMKAAKMLCDRRHDVLFFVVGEDRVCYGGDERSPAARRSRSGCWRRTTTTCRASSSPA